MSSKRSFAFWIWVTIVLAGLATFRKARSHRRRAAAPRGRDVAGRRRRLTAVPDAPASPRRGPGGRAGRPIPAEAPTRAVLPRSNTSSRPRTTGSRSDVSKKVCEEAAALLELAGRSGAAGSTSTRATTRDPACCPCESGKRSSCSSARSRRKPATGPVPRLRALQRLPALRVPVADRVRVSTHHPPRGHAPVPLPARRELGGPVLPALVRRGLRARIREARARRREARALPAHGRHVLESDREGAYVLRPERLNLARVHRRVGDRARRRFPLLRLGHRALLPHGRDAGGSCVVPRLRGGPATGAPATCARMPC